MEESKEKVGYVKAKRQEKMINQQQYIIDQARIAKEIKIQGDVIRDLKGKDKAKLSKSIRTNFNPFSYRWLAKSEDKNAPEILEKVFKLLSIKQLDPEWRNSQVIILIIWKSTKFCKASKKYKT